MPLRGPDESPREGRKDGIKLREQLVCELDDLLVRWKRQEFLLHQILVRSSHDTLSLSKNPDSDSELVQWHLPVDEKLVAHRDARSRQLRETSIPDYRLSQRKRGRN